MRALRIGIHVIVTLALLLMFFWALPDLDHRAARSGQLLCISSFVLFIGACFGAVLELRARRNAAFLNPAIPFVFSLVVIADFCLFPTVLEEEAFDLIFSLVPLCICATEVVLYYMAWHSEAFRD